MDSSSPLGESVVIVGASLAGLRAAEELRRQGFGGRVAMVGSEEHLPYDRPPLSKGLLAGTTEISELELSVGGVDLDLDWHLGRRAVSFDAATLTVCLDDETEIKGTRGVIIATGSTPRRLPGLHLRPGVHEVRTIDDSLALRAALDAGAQRVVVIGAGFIGAEIAATCRQRGLEVTVLEALSAPMSRALSPIFGNAIAKLHRDNGVEVRLNVEVKEIVSKEKVEYVLLADGTTIDCDVVVVGVGVVPNIDWLEGSGLTIDNGVVCDETLSAYPGVVATGDVCRWPNNLFDGELSRLEHWTNAVEQGAAAANRILNENAPPFMPVPFVWSDQYDTKVQIAGMVRPDDEVLVFDGTISDHRFTAITGRNQKLTGVVGFNRPRLVIQCRRLIAEQTPWDQAVEMLTSSP